VSVSAQPHCSARGVERRTRDEAKRSSALLARRRPRAGRRANELARALQLAREARTRPERDRRTAAGYVARLLGRRDAILARTAGELAWSRPGPTPDSLTELVDQVEQERPA
jgi:hypothetical protein